MVTRCVSLEARTEFLNIIKTVFGYKGLTTILIRFYDTDTPCFFTTYFLNI
jgi:hypothetical protein